MKLFVTATVLAVIAWSTMSVRAQESDTVTEGTVEKSITNENDTSTVTPEAETTTEPVLARPPETEAERQARI